MSDNPLGFHSPKFSSPLTYMLEVSITTLLFVFITKGKGKNALHVKKVSVIRKIVQDYIKRIISVLSNKSTKL